MNADDSEILFEDQDNVLENNLYTYCFNNPVNYEDSSGYLAIALVMGSTYILSNIAMGIGATVVIGGCVYRVVSDRRVKLVQKQTKEKKKQKKQSKKSGKETANNPPDWAKRKAYNKNKSAEQNAADVLNEKYGKGNWKKGADTEFSKIKKWLQRSKGYK